MFGSETRQDSGWTIINPYQPPSVTFDDPIGSPFDASDQWLEQQGSRARFSTVVLVVATAESLLLAIALSIVGYALIESRPLLQTSQGPRLITAICLLNVGKIFVLPIWAMQPGPQKHLAIAGSILHPIAALATLFFSMRAIQTGSTVGLLALFGASALALLMVSQSLLVLSARSFAVVQQLPLVRAICGLSVIFFAISASACSLNSLRVFRIYREWLFAGSVTSGLLGQAFLILVFLMLARWSSSLLKKGSDPLETSL